MQILIANEFYNITDSVGGVDADGGGGQDVTDSVNKPRDYARVVLAGFCILAIGSLLTIIFESVMDPNRSRGEHGDRHGGRSHERDAVDKRGTHEPVARVHEPVVRVHEPVARV